jgi:hypothetical protein
MGKYSSKSRLGAKLKKAIRVDGPVPVQQEAVVPNNRRRAVLSIAAVLAIASIVIVTASGKASLLWGPSPSSYYESGYYNAYSYPGDTNRVMQTWQLSRNREFAKALAESEAIVADPKASKEEICTSEVDVSFNAWQVGRFPEAVNALADFNKECQGLQIDPDITTEANNMRKRLARGPSTKYYNAITGHNWAGDSPVLRNHSFTEQLTGWRKSLNSSSGDLYSIGVDPTGYSQTVPSAYLQCTTAGPYDWDALMQLIAANSYRGKRVRFTGEIKTDNVGDDAFLWMRVETPRGNYYARVPEATTAWQRQAIVLDIPQDAQGIVLGEHLVGAGKASLADVHLDEVGNDVPLTPADGSQ